MIQENVPEEITNALNGEAPDFLVKAARKQPLKKALVFLAFSVFWMGISAIFFTVLLGPIFQGKEVHFEMNGVATVAGPGNLKPILIPAIMISVFVLIGLILIIASLYGIFAEGPWFAGTAKRLLLGGKNTVRSIDWEQFSGDIEIVNGNSDDGQIALQMRTGRIVNRKNAPDKYVPDMIYMVGIRNAFQIEQMLRKRIKENDPTPPAVI